MTTYDYLKTIRANGYEVGTTLSGPGALLRVLERADPADLARIVGETMTAMAARAIARLPSPSGTARQTSTERGALELLFRGFDLDRTAYALGLSSYAIALCQAGREALDVLAGEARMPNGPGIALDAEDGLPRAPDRAADAPSVSPQEDEDALALHHAGWTLDAIAEKHGYAHPEAARMMVLRSALRAVEMRRRRAAERDIGVARVRSDTWVVGSTSQKADHGEDQVPTSAAYRRREGNANPNAVAQDGAGARDQAAAGTVNDEDDETVLAFILPKEPEVAGLEEALERDLIAKLRRMEEGNRMALIARSDALRGDAVSAANEDAWWAALPVPEAFAQDFTNRLRRDDVDIHPIDLGAIREAIGQGGAFFSDLILVLVQATFARGDVRALVHEMDRPWVLRIPFDHPSEDRLDAAIRVAARRLGVVFEADLTWEDGAAARDPLEAVKAAEAAFWTLDDTVTPSPELSLELRAPAPLPNARAAHAIEGAIDRAAEMLVPGGASIAELATGDAFAAPALSARLMVRMLGTAKSPLSLSELARGRGIARTLALVSAMQHEDLIALRPDGLVELGPAARQYFQSAA